MEIGLNFLSRDKKLRHPQEVKQFFFSSYYFVYLFNLSACDKSGSRVYPGAVKGIVSLRLRLRHLSRRAARESKTHDCALHCWEGVGRPRERARERETSTPNANCRLDTLLFYLSSTPATFSLESAQLAPTHPFWLFQELDFF
jgi:hypothetical protein